MSDPQTQERYGISVMNQEVAIKYGRDWWQFWKPWKTVNMKPYQMLIGLNEGMRSWLERQ